MQCSHLGYILQLILKHIISSSLTFSEVQQPSGERPKTATPPPCPPPGGGQIHVSPHECFTSYHAVEQCTLCVYKLVLLTYREVEVEGGLLL